MGCRVTARRLSGNAPKDIALDPTMIREVLDVMRDLANAGMSMAVVTHEMGFAREVGDHMVFIDDGHIVAQAPPSEFFAAARTHYARALR